MKKIEEIKYEIGCINRQIAELKVKRSQKYEELRKTVQASFEAEYGVKDGDIVNTVYGKMQYDGFTTDQYGHIISLCHPLKKNGKPNAVKRYLYFNDFIWENDRGTE